VRRPQLLTGAGEGAKRDDVTSDLLHAYVSFVEKKRRAGGQINADTSRLMDRAEQIFQEEKHDRADKRLHKTADERLVPRRTASNNQYA